jgi:hypothetical protein
MFQIYNLTWEMEMGMLRTEASLGKKLARPDLNQWKARHGGHMPVILVTQETSIGEL